MARQEKWAKLTPSSPEGLWEEKLDNRAQWTARQKPSEEVMPGQFRGTPRAEELASPSTRVLVEIFVWRSCANLVPNKVRRVGVVISQERSVSHS